MAITLLGATPRPDDASWPDLGCRAESFYSAPWQQTSGTEWI